MLIKESYQRYYALKKQAVNIRESWLLELATVQAKFDGGDQSVKYTTMLLHEK